jgi:hypothetical protein
MSTVHSTRLRARQPPSHSIHRENPPIQIGAFPYISPVAHRAWQISIPCGEGRPGRTRLRSCRGVEKLSLQLGTYLEITAVIATRAEERHSHETPCMQSQQLRPDPSSVLILSAPAGRSQPFFPFALISHELPH